MAQAAAVRSMREPAARTRSPRIRAKRERRREEILHAALRAFRHRGYHRTTLDDIARRLGVRKTALYHYFPDKEAILYECHKDSLAELQQGRSAGTQLRPAASRTSSPTAP